MPKTKVDFERAGMLFGIVESVANIGPMFTAIANEAMAELREMNEAIVRENAERAKDQPKVNQGLGGQPVTPAIPSQPLDKEPKPIPLTPVDGEAPIDRRY